MILLCRIWICSKNSEQEYFALIIYSFSHLLFKKLAHVNNKDWDSLQNNFYKLQRESLVGSLKLRKLWNILKKKKSYYILNENRPWKCYFENVML